MAQPSRYPRGTIWRSVLAVGPTILGQPAKRLSVLPAVLFATPATMP
jgi:hypothetical protein